MFEFQMPMDVFTSMYSFVMHKRPMSWRVDKNNLSKWQHSIKISVVSFSKRHITVYFNRLELSLKVSIQGWVPRKSDGVLGTKGWKFPIRARSC